MNLKEIKKIAEKARKDFEKSKISKEELAKLYNKYNPDVVAKNFVEEAEKLFPKLNCGLTSIYLKNKILRFKIVKGRYNDYNHTFLLVDKKLIVHITADQYDGPKVYAGPIKKPWTI